VFLEYIGQLILPRDGRIGVVVEHLAKERDGKARFRPSSVGIVRIGRQASPSPLKQRHLPGPSGHQPEESGIR
jgi:hypothetical protein